MRFIGEQISVVEHSDKTTIIIKPKVSAIFRALFGAWLFMWVCIGVSISWYWLTTNLPQSQQVFFLVFMSFWGYFFIKVVMSFLWIMFGSEYVKIDKIALSYKRSLGKYGTAKEYFLENIKKIELLVPSTKSFQAAWENSPWIQGGERIYFDYSGKRIKFGRKLNEKDAKGFFQLVTVKIEKGLKKK
jgi:hypothetical protein